MYSFESQVHDQIQWVGSRTSIQLLDTSIGYMICVWSLSWVLSWLEDGNWLSWLEFGVMIYIGRDATRDWSMTLDGTKIMVIPAHILTTRRSTMVTKNHQYWLSYWPSDTQVNWSIVDLLILCLFIPFDFIWILPPSCISLFNSESSLTILEIESVLEAIVSNSNF